MLTNIVVRHNAHYSTFMYTCMYSKGERERESERESKVSFWSVIHCVIYCTGEWKDKVSPILFK